MLLIVIFFVFKPLTFLSSSRNGQHSVKLLCYHDNLEWKTREKKKNDLNNENGLQIFPLREKQGIPTTLISPKAKCQILTKYRNLISWLYGGLWLPNKNDAVTTRQQSITKCQTYTFFTSSNENMALLVDGNPLVQRSHRWKPISPKTQPGER